MHVFFSVLAALIVFSCLAEWSARREFLRQDKAQLAALERQWDREERERVFSFPVYDWLSRESSAFGGYFPWPEPHSDFERGIIEMLDDLRPQRWPGIVLCTEMEQLANTVAKRIVDDRRKEKRMLAALDEAQKARNANIESRAVAVDGIVFKPRLPDWEHNWNSGHWDASIPLGGQDRPIFLSARLWRHDGVAEYEWSTAYCGDLEWGAVPALDEAMARAVAVARQRWDAQRDPAKRA
jgi:hypothetical protein